MGGDESLKSMKRAK